MLNVYDSPTISLFVFLVQASRQSIVVTWVFIASALWQIYIGVTYYSYVYRRIVPSKLLRGYQHSATVYSILTLSTVKVTDKPAVVSSWRGSALLDYQKSNSKVTAPSFIQSFRTKHCHCTKRYPYPPRSGFFSTFTDLRFGVAQQHQEVTAPLQNEFLYFPKTILSKSKWHHKTSPFGWETFWKRDHSQVRHFDGEPKKAWVTLGDTVR